MISMRNRILTLLCVIVCTAMADAKVVLPQLFQSGMVLQRGKTVPVWGKADVGEQVTIKWQKKQYSATADAGGRWRIDLPKMKAGGPYTMTVQGSTPSEQTTNTIELTDVMVGDVWLLSGQSNIDVTIERVYPQYVNEIESFNNDQVRLFRVQNETNTHGTQEDIRPTAINWKTVTKQNAWLFSAVGTFHGLRMWEKTKVPQGIIVNSWGGTPIEAWISADSLKADNPMLLNRLAIYQNDRYVRAQMQANNEANRAWDELLNRTDNVSSYCQPAYSDADWQTINQNGWSWRGTGSVWLRKHIIIDKEHAGKPARLLLGTLFDQDITYLNGKEIGHTYYQYPPRRYDIPEGLLREGDNVIAVRFINKYGAAHFIPEKPYMLCFGDDRLSQNPMPKDVIPLGDTWKFHLGANMPSCPSGDVSLQNQPTTLYNAVLYPLAPYALSGVVWYQGESNTGNPAPYADYLRKMMGCWRDRWQDSEMPFVIVQLANYDGRQQTGFPQAIVPQTAPINSGWARLREAQRIVAAEDANAALAVINDLGETVDIHPLRKKEVAERIGLCFDRLVYHNNKVKLSPEVLSAAYDQTAGEVVLTLDQSVQPVAVKEMELSDDGNNFRNVEARADGNRIILSAKGFKRPAKVRYAWKDNPAGNVRSLDGLPMSSMEIKIQ